MDARGAPVGWEYHVELMEEGAVTLHSLRDHGRQAALQGRLNALGAAGWELAGVAPHNSGSSPAAATSYLLLFKRPLSPG
jgi:hypothetical protein